MIPTTEKFRFVYGRRQTSAMRQWAKIVPGSERDTRGMQFLYIIAGAFGTSGVIIFYIIFQPIVRRVGVGFQSL